MKIQWKICTVLVVVQKFKLRIKMHLAWQRCRFLPAGALKKKIAERDQMEAVQAGDEGSEASIKTEDLYCQRCFRLRHYNEIPIS